jgi:hypothetical protein
MITVFVMVGLDPTISGQFSRDGRVNPGHDGVGRSYPTQPRGNA